MSPDAINAAVQLIGAGFAWRSAWQLRIDGVVAGVYWPSIAFFTAWGAWNLIYYVALDQWASFVAGLVLVSGNAAWVAQAAFIHFSKRSRTW